MLEETRTWLDSIGDKLPAEAKPLAASLRLIAQSLDAEAAESGRVTGALISGYRQTHRAIVDALKAASGADDPDDASLFGAKDGDE